MLSSHKWSSAKFQAPYRANLLENASKRNKAGLPPSSTSSSSKKKWVLDFVLKNTKHQNFCDSHYLANQYLLSVIAPFLGKEDDAKMVIEVLDSVLCYWNLHNCPIFFIHIHVSETRTLTCAHIHVHTRMPLFELRFFPHVVSRFLLDRFF